MIKAPRSWVALLWLAPTLAGCVRSSELRHHSNAAVDRSLAERPPGQDAARDHASRDGAALDAKLEAKTVDGKPDSKKTDGSKPDLDKTIPGVWIQVPAGIFLMGSPQSEPCRGANETQHQVTLGIAFSIQSTEVTQEQFSAVLGYNPSYFASCGGNCPVETVSWHEAAAYCNQLSYRAGHSPCYLCTGKGAGVTCSEAAGYQSAGVFMCSGYRLPTDAEWENAYRAGTTTGYYNAAVDPAMCGACLPMDPSVDAIAWHCGNAGGATHPAGLKAQNKLGFRDMAGNVREWCHDWYQANLGSNPVTMPWGANPAFSTTRVARGGAFNTNAADVRAAAREHYPPTDRTASVGFRCVRLSP